MILFVVIGTLFASAVAVEAHGYGYGYGHGGYYGSIWIGPGWWGPPYYPYYSQQPVVIQQQTPVYEYEQQAPAQQQPYYWYFCPDVNAYYPYAKTCPGGWKKVVPTPPPSGGKE